MEHTLTSAYAHAGVMVPWDRIPHPVEAARSGPPTPRPSHFVMHNDGTISMETVPADSSGNQFLCVSVHESLGSLSMLTSTKQSIYCVGSPGDRLEVGDSHRFPDLLGSFRKRVSQTRL